jgi:hypothetical protein
MNNNDREKKWWSTVSKELYKESVQGTRNSVQSSQLCRQVSGGWLTSRWKIRNNFGILLEDTLINHGLQRVTYKASTCYNDFRLYFLACKVWKRVVMAFRR